MWKKLLFIALFLFWPFISQAKTELYFFYSETCPHCHKEALFLDKLEDKYPQVDFYRLEVTQSMDNANQMMNMASTLGVDVRGVPFTVVGQKYFIGYYNDQSTGADIEQAIVDSISLDSNLQIQAPSADFIQTSPPLDEEDKDEQPVEVLGEITNEEASVNIPVLGSINAKEYSLTFLSVVLGFLDGFNPCAMWALVFLISLLLGMKDKKRMWILGSVFIVISALVYFLFMAAWLNIFLFLGFIVWIRWLIGLLALGGGAYNIREFFKNKSGACKVSAGQEKKKVFDKLKNITEQKSFFLAIIGISLLAVAVNMVELVCSAGLPAVYTQVLALNDLSTIKYYGYIAIYIFFFMIDDLLVFFVAMITMQLSGLSTKYSRFSSIVGGILMVIIGLLLIFKPDILMFS